MSEPHGDYYDTNRIEIEISNSYSKYIEKEQSKHKMSVDFSNNGNESEMFKRHYIELMEVN